MMKEDIHLNVEDLKNGPPEDGTHSPPDLSVMKLASSSSPSSSSPPPDMETLIIQTVPTGPVSIQNSSSLSSQLLYHHHQHHKMLTEEQEFAEGFVKALEDLHKQNQLNLQPQPGPGEDPSPPSVTAAAVLPELPPVYTSLNSYATSSPLDPMVPFPPPPPHQHHHHHHHHHPTTKMDEPQTVPDVQSLCGDASSPPLSPVNVEVQERIKAERKRLRNRIAATKCRKRKLERISRLEDKVQSLKDQNTDLSSTASLLRDQVDRLKQKVLNHVDSGCQVTVH